MDTDKDYIVKLLSQNLVNGSRPFLTIISHKSDLIKLRSHYYIVSFNEEYIFIESASYFKKLPNKKEIFKLSFNNITKFNLVHDNNNFKSLRIYAANKCIIIYMTKGYLKRAFSEENFDYLIDVLRKKGIKNA